MDILCQQNEGVLQTHRESNTQKLPFSGQSETFSSFCNRLTKEAIHCYFKCESATCTADQTATRDQIIIGTNQNKIREEALLKSWDLPTLRKEGMKIESACKGGAEISVESLNRVGIYSFKNMKAKVNIENKRTSYEKSNNKEASQTAISCFYCDNHVATTVANHKKYVQQETVSVTIVVKQVTSLLFAEGLHR